LNECNEIVIGTLSHTHTSIQSFFLFFLIVLVICPGT